MADICSIETKWNVGKRASIEKALSFVADFDGERGSARLEFNEHLRRRSNRSDWDDPILYPAFDGFREEEVRSTASASFGDYVRLEQIVDFAEGKWGYRLVNYASCSIMDLPMAELGAFLEGTGVEAVSGYTTDVD